MRNSNIENQNIENLNKEINLFNNLGLEHPNKKYIKSNEFTNILFEILINHLNEADGGDNYEH